MHKGMHVVMEARGGSGILFAESKRETAGNFTDPLREGFDLLMVSSVFRVQNWNYLPCTNSVVNRFSKSITDVSRTVYN